MIDFSGQDCRDRSFRGQHLNQANFQGADLRGCDFTSAQLVGANFEGAILGQSRRQQILYWTCCLSISLLALNELATVLFDVLGRSPEDPLWKKTVLLISVYGVGGTLALISLYWPKRQRFKYRIQSAIVFLASSLIGFAIIFNLWGESLSVRKLILAVLAVGLASGLLHYRFQKFAIAQIIFQALSLALAYSFTFWLGTIATMFLSVGSYFWGIAIAVITLLYLWQCWQGIQRLFSQMRSAPGTNFRNSNLGDATFSPRGSGF